MRGFKNSPDVPISLAEMEKEYCRLTQQPYPIKEMVFARSWMLFRVCISGCLGLFQYIYSLLAVINHFAGCSGPICKTTGEFREGRLERRHVSSHWSPGAKDTGGGRGLRREREAMNKM